MTLQFVFYLFVNLNTHSIAHLECFSGYTNVKVCWSHSLQYNFVKARSPLFALNDQLKKKPWSLDEKVKVILCNFLPACLGMWPLDSWCSPTCYWITELYAEHLTFFFYFSLVVCNILCPKQSWLCLLEACHNDAHQWKIYTSMENYWDPVELKQTAFHQHTGSGATSGNHE